MDKYTKFCAVCTDNDVVKEGIKNRIDLSNADTKMRK
jgi:hypothetical protein